MRLQENMVYDLASIVYTRWVKNNNMQITSTEISNNNKKTESPSTDGLLYGQLFVEYWGIPPTAKKEYPYSCLAKF